VRFSHHAKNEMSCDGRAIIVVVAGDDSEFVITTFPEG
jgi:hypothetical protein